MREKEEERRFEEELRAQAAQADSEKIHEEVINLAKPTEPIKVVEEVKDNVEAAGKFE